MIYSNIPCTGYIKQEISACLNIGAVKTCLDYLLGRVGSINAMIVPFVTSIIKHSVLASNTHNVT